MTILLIEDDESLGTQVKSTLAREGYEVDWIRDGDEARRASLEGVELIILDLMLPGTYGMDLLKLFRSESEVPTLILSARSDTHDKVRALELGADDYMTKPFWPEELIARVHARLRRPSLKREQNTRTIGAIEISFDARSCRVSGTEAELTRAEFNLLSALIKRTGSAITREALLDAIAEDGEPGDTRVLDVHMSRLRKKLGDASSQIKTVWGIGYKLIEGA